MGKDLVTRILKDYKKEDPYEKNCPVCKEKMQWSSLYIGGTQWKCSNCTATTYINKIEILQMIIEEQDKIIKEFRGKVK